MSQRAPSPLELVRRTPGNNCGECGYQACLAFAAAVAKGGESPAKCPYIDLSGLDLPKEEEVSNLDETLIKKDWELVNNLKAKIRSVDYVITAPKIGALWSKEKPDQITFRYLDKTITVSKSGMFWQGKELDDPRDQILLYNYIASGGGVSPKGEWCGMESLPNSISKIKTLSVYCEERLAKEFTGKTKELKKALLKIGGTIIENTESADVGAIIPVLPKVPHYLLFWDQDDEEGFNAKVKVLYDRNVLDFLDLESLVFCSERMAETILELTI